RMFRRSSPSRNAREEGRRSAGGRRRCCGDIQRMSVLSVRNAGLTEVTIELILRDGQVIKLSGLADGATAGQRIVSLRSAAGRHDRPMGAGQSAAAGTSSPSTSKGSAP